MGKTFAWLAASIAAIVLACSVPMTGRVADPRIAQQPATDATDPGCAAATLVSTGGAFPKDPKTLAIRWTGFSNFELAFNLCGSDSPQLAVQN